MPSTPVRPNAAPTARSHHPEATARTPFGVERTGYGYGQPVEHPLAHARTVADIERYPWPDPRWMDVSRVRDEALAWGGRFAVLGGDWSPFYHDAIDLLGMETFMVMLVENPAVVDDLLRHIVDYYFHTSLRIFEAAADAIDIFFIGNDFGTQTGPIVGEALFRRFFQPHLARLAALGHDFGLKVMLHCCGGFFPLIPAMIEAGIDALQALQPDARDMAPAKLKAAFGGRVVFNGCDRHAPLAHRRDAGAGAGEDEGDARGHDAGRRLHRLAEPRLHPAGDEGRERLRPLRNGPGIREVLTA